MLDIVASFQVVFVRGSIDCSLEHSFLGLQILSLVHRVVVHCNCAVLYSSFIAMYVGAYVIVCSMLERL